MSLRENRQKRERNRQRGGKREERSQTERKRGRDGEREERREEEREARADSPSPAPVQRGGELIGEVREELEKLLTYLRK